MFIERCDVEAETPILCQLMQRDDSFEKALMLGKIEGRRRRGQQGMRRLDGTADSMDTSLSKFREMVRTGMPGVLQSTGSQRTGRDLVTKQQMIPHQRHVVEHPLVYLFCLAFSLWNNFICLPIHCFPLPPRPPQDISLTKAGCSIGPTSLFDARAYNT